MSGFCSDRRISSKGYVLVKLTGYHPRALSGWIYEHVLVAERALGRFLESQNVIHHHDRNKANNLNSNIVICEDSAYHNLLHARMRVLAAGGDPNTDKLCYACDKPLPLSSFSPAKLGYLGRDNACKACRRAYSNKRFVPRPIKRALKLLHDETEAIGLQSQCLHLRILATGFCLSCGEQVTDEPFDVEAAREMAADREYDSLRDEGLI